MQSPLHQEQQQQQPLRDVNTQFHSVHALFTSTPHARRVNPAARSWLHGGWKSRPFTSDNNQPVEQSINQPIYEKQKDQARPAMRPHANLPVVIFTTIKYHEQKHLNAPTSSKYRVRNAPPHPVQRILRGR